MPFSEEEIISQVWHSDGVERLLDEYRLENGIDPDDDSQHNDDDFKEWFTSWATDRIYDVYYRIRHLIGGDGKITLYRVITAPPDWKPDPKRHPGIFWSWDSGAAQAHWGDYSGNHVEWLITAKVEAQYIDWNSTLSMNVDYDFADEREVRIKENAPVEIVSTDIDPAYKKAS